MEKAKVDGRRYFLPRTKHEAPKGFRLVRPDRFKELRARLRLLGYRSQGGKNLFFPTKFYGKQSRQAVFFFTPENPDRILICLSTIQTSIKERSVDYL